MLRRFFGKKRSVRPGAYGREYAIGDRIEQRFEVESVRRGFMGVVYIAYDRQRRQRVALKTFQNKYLWDQEAITRFNAEVELWMRLGNHPNIVRALDLRILMGKPHVVAEYVHGGPLRALVGRIELREALDYAIQICWGMAYAVEQAAIMHRDLKPDNILVTLDGQIKVTDFGLASVLPSWQLGEHQRDPRSAAQRLRGKGVPEVLAGTLPYMAPELFEGETSIGVWSDIYAFGVTFYELLTGRLPFDDENESAVIRMHLHSPMPDPRRRKPNLPDMVIAILERCLAKRPPERYQSWIELEDDLQDLRRSLYGVLFTTAFPADNAAECERLIEQGRAHMQLNEVNEARHCFAEATERDRSSAEAWMQLALAHLRLWAYHEALVAVDEGLRRAVSRNEFGMLFCVRGEIYTKMEFADEALAAYSEGLSYTPNAPKLWREQGVLLLLLGRLRDAHRSAEQAISYDKLDSISWQLLGDIYVRQQNLRKAADSYSESLRLDPRDAEIWVRYGTCQSQTAHRREAREAFQMALKINPDLVEAQEGLRRVGK
jgi:eukaryotic-like serine/threonine-protein kinase